MAKSYPFRAAVLAAAMMPLVVRLRRVRYRRAARRSADPETGPDARQAAGGQGRGRTGALSVEQRDL
ncbi:hypothetical protein [Sphingopyxis sp. PET50]|uniref:hypothetical protein n=1 Tax=Sphingopyxis sp. PET50 TaxID=2976533 RepID=UPI0021AF76C9|nr:hypothetical protein [Sphingopyxis sp. PET50]